MSRIEWTGFVGENRLAPPLQLRDGLGTLSSNQKPGRGDLRPWREPLTVATVPTGRETIYRMGRDVASDAQYWLSWPTVVHAMRTFSSTDTTERTFFTGDGAPKVTDNTIALASTPYPTASRPMGLPAPATPCTVVTNAGTFTGTVRDSYYVYTYVNDWGWESAPSPVSSVSQRPSDATATLSAFAAVPSGNYQINRIRIYRTQPDATGATEFFYLREITIGTATTADDGRELGRVLPTEGWLPPPADLSFLTPGWNGMAFAISEGAGRICEPYAEYAWNPEYEILPPDGKVIALGTFGQNLLLLTTSRHVLAAGTSPASMDQAPLDFSQGCIAPRSVVSMGAGVAWASNDGLCWYGAGGARVLTAGIMQREDWLALNPASIIGRMYEGLYFGSYDNGGGRKGFMIDPGNPDGMFFLDVGYKAMHFDELQDQLYVLDGGSVKRWDAGATFMTVRARSRIFLLPAPDAFGVGEIVASEYPHTFTLDAVELDPALVTRTMAKRPGVFTAPTPTTLRRTVTVNKSGFFQLPSLVAEKWQLGTESTKPANVFTVASEVDELVRGS